MCCDQSLTLMFLKFLDLIRCKGFIDEFINNPSSPRKQINIEENAKIYFSTNDEAVLHLKLKRPKGLNHIAEYEEKVAHAQGAQQRVEQGRHRPDKLMVILDTH